MDNSLKLGLSQKLTQTLKMTPEMQLAIKILQLNSLELQNQIQEIIETNPVLELDDKEPSSTEVSLEATAPITGEPVPPSKEFTDETRQDFGIDWQRYLQDSENTEFRVSAGSYSDDEETNYENFTTKKENLHEYLERQLHEASLNATEKKIGEYLIGLIDRNGYLRQTREQIADLLKIEITIVDKVIKAIQSMDPPGVGAYDLRECLLIQAREEGYKDDVLTTVIDRHLPDLATNKIAQIAKEHGYEIEDVMAAAETIKQFNPKPGAAFPGSGSEIYVTPDVFIEKEDGEYKVTLNERNLPRLRISPLYRDTMKNRNLSDKAAYEFIKTKLEAARSFLRYVEKRKDTIMNVTKAIIEVQKDFLDFGILHLKPLTLQDVAQVTGVHESTVSRATSGKYAQTPRGLFELKFFFSGGARTQTGEDVSTASVKQRIDNLVRSEDPRNTLSDSDIVNRLKAEGIFLARRTVAKYRSELNIQSSSTRKRSV